MAYFAVGWVVVCMLVLLAECIRGERALNSRLKTLALKGEALSLAEWKPKRPPSDHNLFTELLTRTNRIEVIATNLDVALPSLRLASPAGGRPLAGHWRCANS